jgi:hypothetical protein
LGDLMKYFFGSFVEHLLWGRLQPSLEGTPDFSPPASSSRPPVRGQAKARRWTLSISWGRLQSAEGFSPNFFGFVYGRCAGAEDARNSPHIENGGLKGRLQAKLPAAQKTKSERVALPPSSPDYKICLPRRSKPVSAPRTREISSQRCRRGTRIVQSVTQARASCARIALDKLKHVQPAVSQIRNRRRRPRSVTAV